METDVLTKQEVRGKRNLKTKTTKRQSHFFDDEKEMKGGRRGHGRFHEEQQIDLYDDLDDLDNSIDWKKMIK